MQEWEPGRLVISTAGRDRGSFYLILRLAADNSRVFVVDGENRKVAKPKVKNLKHIKACPEKSGEISEKVDCGMKVTDQDVQRAIQQLMAHYNEFSTHDRCEPNGRAE